MTQPAISYQLQIRIEQPVQLRIGALGRLAFPPSNYIDTGSAKRNLAARIARHRRRDKRLRWHIDYPRNGSWPLQITSKPLVSPG